MTYSETYEEWARYKKRMVKDSTMCAYSQIHYKYLAPAFGNINVCSIGRKDVQAFVYDMLDAGLCVKSVRDLLIVLKMVVRYAAEEYEIPVNISWRIDWPSQNMNTDHVLERYSAEETRRIMESVLAKPAPFKLGILLALTTGMRIGEVCGLRFEDLDWETRTLKVCRTVERYYIINSDGTPGGVTRLDLNEPKTKNSRRVIPLPRAVMPMLKAYSQVSNPDYYICTLSEKVLEPRTYRNFYRNFILKEVGLKRCLKFHALRHTFASMLVENGTDVKTVASILGHSNVSTTLNVYSHPSEEAKRSAIRTTMDRLLKKGGSRS